MERWGQWQNGEPAPDKRPRLPLGSSRLSPNDLGTARTPRF